MTPYPRIPNLYQRDHDTNRLTVEFSTPEFGYLWDAPWEATEKLDGTNVRLILDEDGEYQVKGRSSTSQLPPLLLDHCRGLEAAVRAEFADGTEMCLYGEGVGPRIQKGGERYGDHQHYRLFDVKVGRWWLTRDQVQQVGDALGVPVAPYIGTMTLRDAVSAWSDGSQPPGSLIFDGAPEGWVLRPAGDLRHRDGSPIRVKLKERDFGKLRTPGRRHQDGAA